MNIEQYVTKRPGKVTLNLVLEDIDVEDARQLFKLVSGNDSPVARKIEAAVIRGAVICAMAS